MLMTAGESATPNFDFESIMYGSGITDPGMTEYMQTVAAYERALNGEGGKASIGYDSMLRLLDESWPQHGVSAEVSGRLYLYGDIIDTDTVNRAITEWGEPVRSGDITYWDVAGAQLTSRGIVDDGDESEVNFVCAYSFDNDVIPSFTTKPNESMATYERLTRQGGEHYLRREWPELIEAIDSGLPESSFDANALLQLSIMIASEYQDMLMAYDTLRPVLSEYITYRAQFSDKAPYAVVLEGDLYYFDEHENRTPLRIPEKTLEYIYRPTIVFQNIDSTISVGVVASSGEGLDDEKLLIIPSDTISEFRPTYTGIGLLERIGNVGDSYNVDGMVEIVEHDISFREDRLEHLRNIQMEIVHMAEQARNVATQGYDNQEDALEVAQSGLYSIQRLAEEIGLNECTLAVDGDEIALPPSQYEFNRSLEGRLSVQAIGEAGFMEPGDQRTGYCVDIQPTYRIVEEDGDPIYYPSVVIKLLVSSHTEETMHANDVAMTDITISSYAHVPLESATIVVEGLDAEELIDQTLVELQQEGEEDVCTWLETIYGEVFNPDIEELTQSALEALHNAAAFCANHTNETTVKSIVAVIDSMLNNQAVAINTTEDKNELIAGMIVDVKFERSPDFPPEGLTLSFAGNDGSLHGVAAGSIKTMLPRRSV